MMRQSTRSSFLNILVMALSFWLGASACKAQSASPDIVQAIKLVANRSGWLLANNRLFWTDSLGATWTEITPDEQPSLAVSGAYFSPEGKGWVLQASHDGASLSMAITPDKGAHWSYAPIASPFNEAAVFNGKASPYFVDAQHGWLMLSLQSSSAFRRGLLLRTTDGGLHWTQAPTPPVGDDLTFIDPTHGFTGPGPNGDELFQTSDSGTTWHSVSLPLPYPELASIHSTITLPSFTAASQGTLLRTFVGDQGTTIIPYLTADGGATWQATTPDASSTFKVVASDGTVTANIIGDARLGLSNLNATVGTLTPILSSFSSQANGMVLFSGGACNAEQGVCTQARSLMATLDGGRTYFSVGQIQGLSLESTQQRSFTRKSPSIETPQPLEAQPRSSFPVIGVDGFDACSLPTVAQLQTWWTSSPYKTVGTYIGGNEFACASGLSNLTSIYVASVLSQGWEIVPIWVGPQAPGGSFAYSISTTTSTAYTQGVTEADSAVAAMAAVGMKQGSTIVYDMEAYSYSTASYVAATQSFISGWNTELHAKGYLAGVYSGHYEFDNWTPVLVTPAIDTIWFTYFFNSGVSCGPTCETVYPTTIDLPAAYWTNHHRSRQTSSSFNSTYGGLTLNIDEDYTDAAFEVATPIILTAAKAGTGKGTVATATINNSLDTSIDTAISCGPTCTSASSNFAATDTVTLTAVPASGAVFTNWAGCTSTSGATCTIATTATSTVTANFTAATTYTLTVAKSGTGSGTVTSSDGYISCGTVCSGAYVPATSVTLTAVPSTGSLFVSWTGCTSTTSTCTVATTAAAATVTVVFNTAPTFTAALSTASLSIVGGQSATDIVTITPRTGYTGSFTAFACTGLPSSATCTFSPTSLTSLGDGSTLTSTLTVTTIPVFKASISQRSDMRFAVLFLPALMIPWLLRRRKALRGRVIAMMFFACVSIGLSQLLTGCTPGNPAPFSTIPPGVPFSGTINVTFTSASGTTQLPLALTITNK